MHGWLILDKPLGLSSAQAVARVKRALKPEKIGHAGTLDPLASGILPLALGEATKTVAYMMATSKAYAFTVTWGEQRDTDDAGGKVIATSSLQPEMSNIVTQCHAFLGRQMQAPPAYAAVKIEGKRAYALARAGVVVQPEPREVQINALELLECRENSADFALECGKGTYVRSLARDMALALGTVGYVSALRRTRVGAFAEAHAISLENLEEIVHNGRLAQVLQMLQPVESVLDDIPARDVSSTFAQKLRHGQAIPVTEEPGMVQVRHGGKLLALCQISAGLMKPVRVFNL